MHRLVQATLILDYTYYYMFNIISHAKQTVILYSVIQYNSRTEESKLMCTKSSLTSLHLSVVFCYTHSYFYYKTYISLVSKMLIFSTFIFFIGCYLKSFVWTQYFTLVNGNLNMYEWLLGVKEYILTGVLRTTTVANFLIFTQIRRISSRSSWSW